MSVIQCNLIKILSCSIFILCCNYHVVLAQEKFKKTVDMVYNSTDKIKVMYILEKMFSQEYIDDVFNPFKKNPKHTDSIRKDIAQYLAKQASTSNNQIINNLIYSKLGSEYIKRSENSTGFSYLKKAEKGNLTQNPPNLYYFYFLLLLWQVVKVLIK